MTTYTNRTLAVLINAIDQRLLSAVHHTNVSAEALHLDQQDQAIGSLLVIEQDLELALLLYRATIALHRTLKGGAA